MQVDFIVVGQGLSGSWVSWFLMQHQKTFVVIDKNESQTASRNSAGIMNPMTGKRYAETPLIEKLFPFAKKSYNDVGLFFKRNFIQETAIIDFFSSSENEELFDKRLHENSTYLSKINGNDFLDMFNFKYGVGKIAPCFKVNVLSFLDAMKQYLQEQNQFIVEEFDENLLSVNDSAINYKNIKAKKIIFCDGVSSSQNKWWNHLKFANTKGEVLLVKINDLNTNFIYKYKHLLVPIQDNIFWFGASNTWKFNDDKPSIEFYEENKKKLQEFLKIPFEIVNHTATIRPTLNNRMPIATIHSEHHNMGILNGMGTKGSSQSPFYAKQLVDEMCL